MLQFKILQKKPRRTTLATPQGVTDSASQNGQNALNTMSVRVGLIICSQNTESKKIKTIKNKCEQNPH